MQRHCPCAQGIRWLDGDDTMPHRREDGGIAACSRADVQDTGARLRKQMQHDPVNFGNGEAPITFEEPLSRLGIPFRAADSICHGEIVSGEIQDWRR